jgi:transposase InsO family protein
VERFYRVIYGHQIPVIESAVISGRAQMRLFGITFPGCFRFTHIAGQDYRHYIEAFYNRRRRHSSLDYFSPEAYEQLYRQQHELRLTPCPQN